MGCVVCKPLSATSAEDLCFSLFFSLDVTSAGKTVNKEVIKSDPLKPPPRQHIVTSPERDKSGWPTWLSAAAGDALTGWAPRRADSFEKLEKIGSGTYSNVYKATDLENGAIVALKKVRIDGLTSAAPINETAAGTTEAAKFMVREIALLRHLEGQENIVKLEGLVTSRVATSASLYLVFEYMDHDLAGLAAQPGVKFSLPQIKCYMKQLLSGLDHCHKKGVLHRDIKTSNLLLSKDGVLKIADFGLATSFDPNSSRPMTSQVITLWYRPPELLLGTTFYGIGVDLWSVGCILGELLTGQPVFPARTEGLLKIVQVEQLHRIFKLCGTPSEEYWKKLKLPKTNQTTFKVYERCLAETFKDVPSSALALLETLLSVDPEARGTASDALNSDFLNTEPHACEPSSLPQYPPSKEMDIRLRNQEKRRKAKGNVSVGYETKNKVRLRNAGQLKALLTPDICSMFEANSEVPRLVTSASVRTKIEKFPPPHLDGSIGYSLDTSSNASEELSSEIRKEKIQKRILKEHNNHPMRNPSRKKVGAGTASGTSTKVKSSVKMMPNPVLIGGFIPNRIGKNKVHGRG